MENTKKKKKHVPFGDFFSLGTSSLFGALARENPLSPPKHKAGNKFQPVYNVFTLSASPQAIMFIN